MIEVISISIALLVGAGILIGIAFERTQTEQKVRRAEGRGLWAGKKHGIYIAHVRAVQALGTLRKHYTVSKPQLSHDLKAVICAIKDDQGNFIKTRTDIR